MSLKKSALTCVLQNWPTRKEIIIFSCICLAGFAGQMSPNSNQLTFILQIPTYNKTQADLLDTVAASLAGWMAGPFIIGLTTEGSTTC